MTCSHAPETLTMQFHEHKRFRKALNALYKRGGPYQKAADEIHALLGRIGDEEAGDPFRGMRRTKQGESRIDNVAKYDLQRFSRLVTVQADGYCILLYCGDHEECDRWIAEHRGLAFLIGDNKRVVETYRSLGDAEDQRVGGEPGHDAKPLYQRLPEELYESLMEGTRPRVSRALERFDATVTDGELWEAVSGILDDERRLAVYDVFAQLRADRSVQAVARIKAFQGHLVPLDAIPQAELPDLVDSDVLRRIDPKSPQYREALKRFMQSVRYRDWMLFMHPDQDRVVDEDFEGPAKLAGVSGSGKTCVIVRRAVRLAESYPGQRILVLTLNRALAHLIDELVTACAPEEVRGQIEVRPFFALCQQLMLEIDPRGEKMYNEVTWKSSEHVDEIWQEYYRCEANNEDATAFQPVHDSLLSRGWSPERYLRGEVDWLRSALRPKDRSQYLTIERTGRRVVFPRAFRQAVLDGAHGWEDKMAAVGVIDTLGLAQALIPHLPGIRPRYRCVLVDEVQDFGNLELEIVRALVPAGQNDMFLCGDAAQAVTTKHQRFRDIGITIPGARSRKLVQNYRNSRDVLAAAYEVFTNNLSDELLGREDLEVMDPEFSAFTASTPVLLGAPDFPTELRAAFAFARDRAARDSDAKICMAVCGFSLYELTRFAKRVGCPILDGTSSLDAGNLFISDLAQTKGFEFDMMCIVNCANGVLPDATAPDEERHRDLAMLYVAMTRAKTDLVLSWSGAPSPFFTGSETQLLTGMWAEYVPELANAPIIPRPQRLDADRERLHARAWRDMSGEEFLFTRYALGASLELSAKLRTLVDGRGLRKGTQRLRWRTIGEALDYYRDHPRVRNLWGPEVGRQLLELTDKLPGGTCASSAPAQGARTVPTLESGRTGVVGRRDASPRTDAVSRPAQADNAERNAAAAGGYAAAQFAGGPGGLLAGPPLSPSAARDRLIQLRQRIWRETGAGPTTDGLLRRSMIDAFLEHRPTDPDHLAETPLQEMLPAVRSDQRQYLPAVFEILQQLEE